MSEFRTRYQNQRAKKRAQIDAVEDLLNTAEQKIKRGEDPVATAILMMAQIGRMLFAQVREDLNDLDD